jgi:membrane protein DedA with SNARE-associated domain
MEWFNSLVSTAMAHLSQGSYTALISLFLIASLTEIGVPFPFVIDAAILLTSYQSGFWSVNLLMVILALTLGREAGGTAIYFLSRFAGNRFIRWLSRRFPFLKIETRMARISTMISRRATLMVAIVRLTPGLLTPSSVAAGCSQMKYYQFVLGIVLASVIADGALVLVGAATKYGLSFMGITPKPWQVVLLISALILLIWLLSTLVSKYRAKRKSFRKI